MLKIITAPNPLLTKVSTEITANNFKPNEIMVGSPDGPMTLQVLISVMVATMYANPACGLAAPQLGVSKRVIVYNPDEDNEPDDKDTDKTVIMVNPVIKDFSDATNIESETCLSLPGIEANIKRHTAIIVEYLDEDLEVKVKSVKDWEAKIIQHEIDHLDGYLFWDRKGTLKGALQNKYRLAKIKANKQRKHKHG